MRYLLLAVMAVSLVGCESKQVAGGDHAGNGRTKVSASSTVAKDSLRSEQKITYTRDAFKKLVMGKSMDEVKAVLGKPDATGETLSEPYWDFKKVTTDPASEKTDDFTRVQFKKGVVDSVIF